jgi:hypothetical protein
MQYYSAAIKNDAILQRAIKKRCNILVRGHKISQNIAI